MAFPLPRLLLPRLTVWAILALTACACAHAADLRAQVDLRTEVGEFRLEYAPNDAGAPMVARAIAAAAPKLERWGQLQRRVEVRVMPDHASLEKAVGRSGYGWLRAWGLGDMAYVQSPSSWGDAGPSQAQVDELVLHELAHCLMYQRAAPEDGWRAKGIVVWFREGMASVIADQGYRRGSLVELQRRFANAAEGDPLEDADELYRHQSQVVYSAAHHAFAFLLQRYGEDGVRRILAAMHGGANFEEGFRQAIGIDRKDFELEFRHYVQMQGWRAQPD